eukprot:6639067-Alexandrium_andersonii.AAC.1
MEATPRQRFVATRCGQPARELANNTLPTLRYKFGWNDLLAHVMLATSGQPAGAYRAKHLPKC